MVRSTKQAKPHLKKFWRDNIRTIGFARDVEKYLSQATIHIFPSQLEGSAKVTYEAAACGLPQVVTRESGDVVRDGIDGIIVPPGRCRCHRRRHRAFLPASEIVSEMGIAARKRVVENFTWDHFRERLRAGRLMRMADCRCCSRLPAPSNGGHGDRALRMKILLIQLRRLGDLILTTPAISALREHLPGAQIALAVSGECAPLLPAIQGLQQTFLTKRGRARSFRLDGNPSRRFRLRGRFHPQRSLGLANVFVRARRNGLFLID